MPSKKIAQSADNKEQDKAPTFTGRTLNEFQTGKIRMRCRDFLADSVTKILDEEVKAQEKSLEAGKTLNGTETLNTSDLTLMSTALSAVMAQTVAATPADKKTNKHWQKLVADVAVQQARIKMCLEGNLKALSPAEKARRAELAIAKMAELAKLQAELDALAL